LNNKFVSGTEEANKIVVDGGKPSAAKKHANKIAGILDLFVDRMAVDVSDFSVHSSRSMELYGTIALNPNTQMHLDEDIIAETRSGINTYVEAITGGELSSIEFKQAIKDLPSMTTSFNRSRKRAVAVLDDLQFQFKISQNQATDVDNLLAELSSAKSVNKSV